MCVCVRPECVNLEVYVSLLDWMIIFSRNKGKGRLTILRNRVHAVNQRRGRHSLRSSGPPVSLLSEGHRSQIRQSSHSNSAWIPIHNSAHLKIVWKKLAQMFGLKIVSFARISQNMHKVWNHANQKHDQAPKERHDKSPARHVEGSLRNFHFRFFEYVQHQQKNFRQLPWHVEFLSLRCFYVHMPRFTKNKDYHNERA